jgi:ubiquinone/menaquinone biosynthesis C-methylase UbiE
VSDVARLFDRMADSYDELEPWYEHLYDRLHAIVRAVLAPTPGARALDAGCGTGFQTALLRELGFIAHGVDLSSGLLAIARAKLPDISFARADLEALPYPSECMDAITCCGSTLSFVEDPPRAIAELGRILRPGGTLVLEYEHKWSLDLVWTLISALTGDSLGYHVRPSDAVRQVARPWSEGFRVDYPVALPDGGQEYMRLRLFTMTEIARMLRTAHLVPRRVVGIHGVTNLIPSPVLHRDRLSGPVARLYRALAAIDRGLGETPAWRIANSVVVVATRSSRSGTMPAP